MEHSLTSDIAEETFHDVNTLWKYVDNFKDGKAVYSETMHEAIKSKLHIRWHWFRKEWIELDDPRWVYPQNSKEWD
jgi:hypothetical protein